MVLCKQSERVTDETVATWDIADKDETGGAVIIPFSAIQERETEWLWHNKIPAGELCLLTGLAGQGKTFWTCYLAAMVSNGWNWPDGTPCPKGNVLFFRGEDSIEKTMKPRLSANGADVSNVFLFDSISDGSVLTLNCITEIRDGIAKTHGKNDLPLRLVIIDPMADYLGDTKENSNVEVRGVLKQLKSIADETGVVFLLIQHLGKGDRESIQQRVLGSTGIVASCQKVVARIFGRWSHAHRQ
jgi:putative DNA primase/helicase